jgi:hypothetical protein
VLEPNKGYVIELQAKDASTGQVGRYALDGTPLQAGQQADATGFAPGAIVDFDVTL